MKDKEVQKFIKAQRDCGAIVTRSTVVGIGRGVVLKHNKFLLAEFGGHINITKHWAESILHSMKFVKRRGSTKVHVTSNIFDKLKKQFLVDIQATVVIKNIPNELIINWDKTAISIVPGSAWTMAPSGSRRVEVMGLGDKRQITAVFAGTLSGAFLPLQLIYAGKTAACHPNGVVFPQDWHITHTANHWANEATVKDYIVKIVVPYVEHIRATKYPAQSSPQPALVIFDVFRGQMCQSTIDILMEHSIHYVHIPPNCTDRLQPMDLSVNKSCKDFMRNRFIEWYSQKVCDVLINDGSNTTQPEISLRLSSMKPLGGEWLKLFHQHMMANPGIIRNGCWRQCCSRDSTRSLDDNN